MINSAYLLVSFSESLLFFLDDDPLSRSLDDDFLFREGLAALAIESRKRRGPVSYTAKFDDPVPLIALHGRRMRMRTSFNRGHEAGQSLVLFSHFHPSIQSAISLQGCGSEVQHQTARVRAGENPPAVVEGETARSPSKPATCHTSLDRWSSSTWCC